MSFILSGFLVLTGLCGAALESEFIFPPQDKHVHASSIVETPQGDLLVAWFHGSGERWADDVQVQGARLRKGESEWSPVFVMADTPDFPDCNPVLYIDARERLWLFWVAVMANEWENSLLKYRRADSYNADGPPEWNWQDVIILKPSDNFSDELKEAFKIVIPDEGMWGGYAPPYAEMLIEAGKDKLKRQLGWMTRNHPLTLDSGRILLPLYSDGFNISMVAYSDDLGESWLAGAPIVGLGPIQPTLIRKQDGTIFGFFRDSGDEPQRIQQAESTDDGIHWTVTEDTDIPNPSSSMELKALSDGSWILIFNDTEEGRHRLAVAISRDEGKTWPWKRHLDQRDDRRDGSFGYPSIIQAQDGTIHATYSYKTEEGATIKHAAFAPEWVTAAKRKRAR
ncbi:MAG: exo-alpha-sialidase [Candidatus Hydrogenedens sp.]|jgi:predicted neuraminidase|nr:exo-alpha-sialidase [Candidatus Hydrogenedens sp.]